MVMSVRAAGFSSQTSATPTPLSEAAPSGWKWAALVVALVGLAGSLFLSWGMSLKACPLCFYQRTFMMSVVAVLGVGLLIRAGSRWLSLLLLPLAVAGLGVALFHVYLEITGKLECPGGLFGWGTPPKQSLAVFLVLCAVLVVDVLRDMRVRAGQWSGLAGAIILGSLLAGASCTSNPPMPPPPPEPYAKPPDMCRPPYRAP
jgi:hypothetical protein